jgi:hypothetical protein
VTDARPPCDREFNSHDARHSVFSDEGKEPTRGRAVGFNDIRELVRRGMPDRDCEQFEKLCF